MFFGFIVPAFISLGLIYLYNIQTTTKYKIDIAIWAGFAVLGWVGTILVSILWCIYLLNLMTKDSDINKKFKGE